MTFQLRWSRYLRPFSVPLRNARGSWYEREGIVLRLEGADGKVGYGEVAPLPEFGTERVEEAAHWLESLGETVTAEELGATPGALRCCQFALGSAQWMLETPQVDYFFRNTALLPSGEAAASAAAAYVAEGFRTFKLKIGIEGVRREQAQVLELLEQLPSDARLRLDANASFDENTLVRWLEVLDGVRRVELLEQPLPVGMERRMRRLAAAHEVAVALDESLVSIQGVDEALRQLRWFGPLVLKSSLLGPPKSLFRLLQTVRNPLVFSSVFETGIGLHAGLRVAAASGARLPVGYGTVRYFADGLNGFEADALLASDAMTATVLEKLWQTICGEFAKA